MNEWVCNIGGMTLTGKNGSSRRRKPVPGPLCPPRIPHGLAWNWARGLRGDRPATNRLRHGTASHIMRYFSVCKLQVYWPHITCLIYASESYCNKAEKHKRLLLKAFKTSFCFSCGRMVSLCSESIWTVQNTKFRYDARRTFILGTLKTVNNGKNVMNTEAVFHSSRHVLFETFFASINTYLTTFAGYTNRNAHRYPCKMSVVFVRF